MLAEEQAVRDTRAYGPMPAGTLRRRLPRLFWAYSFLLVALSRTWTARFPGGADAELFAYIGREWHRGVRPYTGIWDDKPPGIFAVNWLAAFSHAQFRMLACFEFVALALSLVLVSRIFALLDPKSEALWIAPFLAANCFAISAYTLGGNYTEIYLLPFAAWSIYAFLHAWTVAHRAPAWYVLAGFAAGLASAFKPVGMAPTLAALAFLLLAHRRPFGLRLRAAALMLAGFLAVWGLLLAVFASFGAARLMVDATLTYNLHYGGANHVSLANKLLLSMDRLLPVSSILGCAVVAVALRVYSWRREGRGQSPFTAAEADAAVLFALWVGADVAGANAGGRYYPHYFFPATLSLSVLAGLGLLGILRLLHGSGARSRAVLVSALLIPIGLMGLRGQIDEYHSVSGNPVPTWQKIAQFVRTHRQPRDTLFTWEFNPGIYRLSDSYGTTRWASAHYIEDFPAAYTNIGGELMRELQAAPPTFMVYSCDLHAENAEDTVRAQFLVLIASRYTPAFREGGECIARRR